MEIMTDMTQTLPLNIKLLEEELCEVLQTTDQHRILDSLEIVVVRSKLAAHGIRIDRMEAAKNDTIGEWLAWLHKFSPDGLPGDSI